MLSPITHPFIFNTLESSPAWSLQTRKYPDAWEVEMWFYEDDDFSVAMSRAEGLTLSEALDNLERLLETGSTET